MKILLCGDTHLGKRNFKIKKREMDFEKAFKKVVDYAVNNEIHAVLHTGDLFDTGKPSIRTILFTIKELKRLRKNNIPVFIIAGSHDIGVDGSFLKVLHELNLVINLTDKRYYEQKEDKIIIRGEKRKGLFVCGLPGRRSRINEVLELAEVEFENDCFKIFLFHHIISDINPLFSSVKKSCLPKGFDLYVSGHWHEFFESSFNNKLLLYPGSTENSDFREMKRGNDKGFIIYDTESDEYDFIKIETRESIVKEVNCSGLSSEEVVEELLKSIKPGNGDMLFFVLKGTLEKGIKSSINRRRVYKEARKKGYLFCKIYTSSLQNPRERQTLVENKSISEIEKDFLKKKGLNKDEVVIARELIKELGKDYTPSDLDKKTKDVVKFLKGEVL